MSLTLCEVGEATLTHGVAHSGGGKLRGQTDTKSSDTESGLKCFLPILTEKMSGIFC